MTQFDNPSACQAMDDVTQSVDPVRFHLSLNVAKFPEAIEFYQALFNSPPSKQHADYAKFDVDDPALVFSLTPRPTGQGGSLSHLGLRVGDPRMLDVYRTRLESAGICTSNQEGTVCGYARQDKLWLRDPDGNFWEIYHVFEDVVPDRVKTIPLSAATMASNTVVSETPKASSTWEHYITGAWPERIPFSDNQLDEVLLTGTFNLEVPEEQLTAILLEAFRTLKPDGVLTLHGLMSDKPLTQTAPALPGMAALVQKVPAYGDVLQQLRTAGFVNTELAKLTGQAWFEVEGVPLREVKIRSQRQSRQPVSDAFRTVLYRGPFAQLMTDDGHRFVCGKRVSVSETVWQSLHQGSTAESFVFFEADAGTSCGSE